MYLQEDPSVPRLLDFPAIADPLISPVSFSVALEKDINEGVLPVLIA